MTAHQNPESPTIGPDAEVWTMMTRAVARISPDAHLNEVARKLAAVEAGALAVGSSESITGVVSERDLTRAYGRIDDVGQLTAGDVASTDLIWCAEHTTAEAAARQMCDRGVRHLLIGDGDTGDLRGIVSARDLIEALVGS